MTSSSGLGRGVIKPMAGRHVVARCGRNKSRVNAGVYFWFTSDEDQARPTPPIDLDGWLVTIRNEVGAQHGWTWAQLGDLRLLP
jgi:hypothetical protein